MNGLMRVFCCASAFSLLVLCVSCGSSQAPTASSPGTREAVNMLCFTTPTAQVVRISAVFPIRTTTPTIMLEEPWAQEFRVYIGQSNGKQEGTSVSCAQVSSKDAEKEKADELRKQGHQVIETGWTYAGG